MINIARKKPVEVEVCKWTGENWDEIQNFCGDVAYKDVIQDGMDCGMPNLVSALFIYTLEGSHQANIGDYIIKGINGEFYPCKPDIFEKTYDIITTF